MRHPVLEKPVNLKFEMQDTQPALPRNKNAPQSGASGL
jgi:hypothetical protein